MVTKEVMTRAQADCVERVATDALSDYLKQSTAVMGRMDHALDEDGVMSLMEGVEMWCGMTVLAKSLSRIGMPQAAALFYRDRPFRLPPGTTEQLWEFPSPDRASELIDESCARRLRVWAAPRLLKTEPGYP